MRFVFIPEILQRAQDRVRGCLAQTTKRSSLDIIREVLKQLHVSFPAFARGYPFEYFKQPLCTYPAGHAFAAGFVLGELEKELRYVDHAVVFVEYDHAP